QASSTARWLRRNRALARANGAFWHYGRTARSCCQYAPGRKPGPAHPPWTGSIELMEAAMLLGVPKETKVHEYRVGMTPASVREVTSHGHKVMVETNAGAGIGASDDAYRDAGAEIADS